MNRSTEMELEDETVAHVGNKELARWFAEPSSKDYWFHVRIVGSILELHAEHIATEHRYVARARRMDEAAPELLHLIRTYPPTVAAGIGDDSSSVVARAWRQASKAVSRMYHAVAR